MEYAHKLFGAFRRLVQQSMQAIEGLGVLGPLINERPAPEAE